MSKDPAFLMYSKDWLQGTAELTHQEKGVFIDLLCHQHQNGSLPSDPKRLARLAGMSEIEFQDVWSTLSEKFSPVYDANALPNASAFAQPNASAFADRLANKKLVGVMGERQDNAHVNYIISVWSHILRESELSKMEKDKIRKQFKVNDFKKYSREEIGERIREWWCERTCVRTPLLEDAIVDGDEDANSIINTTEQKLKIEIPTVYKGRKLTTPSSWPKEKFELIWNEWRIHRKKKHGFVFDKLETEQSSLNRFAQDVSGKQWEWIEDCIKYSMENGWMRVIPEAYEKSLRKSTKSEVHNGFNKTAKAL